MVVGSDPTKVVIKGILVTANQVIDSEPVFEGDMITCVAVMGVAPAGATRMIVTDAFIFPGFIGAEVGLLVGDEYFAIRDFAEE